MANVVGVGIRNCSYQNDTTTPVNVAAYCRVSTEHEAQMEAIESQIEWMQDYVKRWKNWNLVDMYVDRGISGTLLEERDDFQRLLSDARKGRFNIIACREIARFSRDTLASIQLTRELAEIGVECVFINDGIWSLSGEGELKIALMSTLAQEESRKAAIRVYSGLEKVRDRHTLLGNGNILGYRLVRGEKAVDNTYEIIPEDAETVRMIYDCYLRKGMGIKAISREMVRLNRRNASGKCEWDPTRVRRSLRNRTYSGYIGYFKSNTISYLKHNRKNNNDRSTYQYVKGNYPAIIPDEDWQAAQLKLDARTEEYHGKRRGVNPARNVWLTKLHCSCGSHMKRYHWRTNSHVYTDGIETPMYGYACANVVNNGSKRFRKEACIEDDDIGCSVKSFPEWKLVFSAQQILSRLLKNPEKTKSKMVALIRKHYEPFTQPVFTTRETYEKDLAKVDRRLKSLFEMRMDGSITSDEFKENKQQLEEEKTRIIQKLEEIDITNDALARAEDMDGDIAEITVMLDSLLSLDGTEVNEELIRTLVDKIVPCPGYVFKWYLNLRKSSGDEPVLVDSFHITYEQASEYRKKCGTYVRKNQWPTDLLVEVYI